jgi:PAS domain S-box-containing protein
MKSGKNIILISALFGLLFWIIDSCLDFFIFYRGSGPFASILITAPPAHEIYVRSTVILLFVFFGLLFSRAQRRRRETVGQLERSTEQLHRINRAYKALTECNRCLVRAQSEQEMLEQACQCILEAGGYRLAWIGFAEHDADKTVRPAAAAGYEDGYLEKIKLTWSDTPAGRGPTGTAIRTGKPSAARNLQTDPDFALWREQAMARGYGSSIALPLLANGQAFGALNIYAVEPDAFDEGEVGLLKQLAADISFAIMALRLRSGHAETTEALRESQRILSSLSLNLPGIFYRCCHDPDRAMEFVSEGSKELLGYRPEDLVNNRVVSYGKLIHAQDRDHVWSRVRESLAQGKPFRVTYRVKHADGKEKWVLEQGLGIIAPDGEITGIEGVIIDITEQKRLEEQLLQSQKMEAVGRLAGGVAHDFNNQLTVIMGLSELLIEALGERHPNFQDALEIKQTSQRAASLTSQLLAFSRKQVMQLKVLDLNFMVKDMEKMLRRLLGEDVELATMLDPDLGEVRADPTQVEQIIMNLAINARDAMPAGGKLTIETANVTLDEEYAQSHVGAAAGPHVMLSVSDTGHGMDDDTRERIFEPFFTTKKLGMGTGLGLSTVYGIVKQNGGNIWVYSELGQGTTFKVYLPRIEDGQEETPPEKVQEETPAGNETILLVEDDEIVRKLARRILREKGYTVIEAKSASDAILIAESYSAKIHILVTDVVLPDKNGRELMNLIAAGRPGIKVLYMSGYTDNAIVHHGVLEPGTIFLQKPFTPDTLIAKVREALQAPY